MELTNEDIKTVNYGLLETNAVINSIWFLENNQNKNKIISFSSKKNLFFLN